MMSIGRREFIEKVIVIGGLAALQPWEILRHWETIAEARTVPLNNIIVDEKLVVASVSNVISHGVNAGNAVWQLSETTDPMIVYPNGATSAIKLDIVTPGTAVSEYDLVFAINTTLLKLGRIILPIFPVVFGGSGNSYTSFITISQDAGFVNGYTYQFLHTIERGWFDNVRLVSEPTTIVGSPSISNTFTRVRIRIRVPVGMMGTFYISDLIMNPKTISRIAIGFDDRNVTEFSNAIPYMRDRQIPGYSCAISSFGTLTVAQMQEMVEYGWSIHNHTKSHLHMTTLSESQVVDEVEACKLFLRSNGLHDSGKHVFVYPFNDGNDATDSIVSQRYMTWTRSTGTGGMWGFRGSMMRDQTPTKIFRRISMDNPTLPSQVIDNINLWVKFGVDGIILGHNPLSGASSGHTELANLKTIVDVLYRYQQAGVVRCVNMNELIIGLGRGRKLRLPLVE